MGVVFHARERATGRDVALKTLRAVDAQGIYRLKQEFRALRDIDHDNLIRLGELFSEGGQWFFTMELIEGVGLLEWIRGKGTLYHEGRLRDAFRQLVTGVMALHETGRVHRDIKPSNILVTGEGRLVLLDFGLATAVEGDEVDALDEVTEENVVGTVAYMAPEQATGMPPGPEADWYSVGVVLFEALTGELPFSGAALEVMMDKQRLSPRSPCSLAPHVPRDLDQLCVELLRFDPKQRPTPAELVERLGIAVAVATPTASSVHRRPFVGREREVRELEEAFEASRAKPVTVLLTGESGIGKTLLLRRYVERLGDDAVIFRGRCFQREAVPFKGFDDIVDSISRYLHRFDQVDVALMLPRDVDALTTVFPVLERVPAIARALTSRRAPTRSRAGTLQDLRFRAFRALSELIAAIAEREPVVLVIDDLQWADADSLALLRDLVAGPIASPLLLVGAVRTDGMLTTLTPSRAPRASLTPTLARSIPPAAEGQPQPSLVPVPPEGFGAVDLQRLDADVRVIQLGRLLPEDAIGLVIQLAGVERPHARAIAQEAENHPLFIHELVRHRDAAGSEASLRLGEAIWARVDALDEPARRLLVAVCVAAGPITAERVAQAAGLDDHERWIGVLRVAHLVRTIGPRGAMAVEAYHDRIRSAVLGQLDERQLVEEHRALATALRAAPAEERDPQLLVHHLVASGHPREAADEAARAAAAANGALAFEQAAALLTTALELLPEGATTSESNGLRLALAEALRSAGRGREAAYAFLAAAAVAEDRSTRQICRRNAAQQLLVSGHIGEGLEALSALLGEVGERLATSRLGALARLVVGRVALWLRGYRYRIVDDAPAELLERVDLYRAIARGLSFVDPVQGAAFHTRSLRLALRSGDKARVAWALTYEFVALSLLGRRFHRRAKALLDEARQLNATMNDGYLAAIHEGMGGFLHYSAGEYLQASRTLGRYEGENLDIAVAGPRFEVHNARMFRLFALRHSGEFREFKRCFDTYLVDAVHRGDRYLETALVRAMSIRWIYADDPDKAREQLDRDLWMPPGDRFHVQHWYDLMGRGELALYTGQGARFRAAYATEIAALQRSQLLRLEVLRTTYWWLFGRLALAELVAGRGSLRDVQGFAKRLRGTGHPAYSGWGQLLEAGLCVTQGDRERALGLLASAGGSFEERGLALYRAVAQRRQGELVGGDAGRALVDRADAWMTEEEFAVPTKMADLYAPGFEALTKGQAPTRGLVLGRGG